MPRLGILSKAFVNVGNESVPSWSELSMISDMTVNAPWEEGEASTRAARAKLSEPTQIAIEISMKLRVQGAIGVTGYLTLVEAYRRDLPFDFLVLNGGIAENEAEGYRFWAKAFNMSEDQSLGVVIFKDVTVKPCIPPTNGSVPRAARVTGTVLAYGALGAG